MPDPQAPPTAGPDFSGLSDQNLQNWLAPEGGSMPPQQADISTSPATNVGMNTFLSQNLPYGAAIGGATALTGGTLPGAMMGALSMLNPPQNASQAGQQAIMQALMKPLSNIGENIFGRLPNNPLVQAAARGALGAGYEQTVNRAISAATGHGADPTASSTASSFLIPAALGYFYHGAMATPSAQSRTLTANINKSLQDITGESDIKLGQDPMTAAAQSQSQGQAVSQNLQTAYSNISTRSKSLAQQQQAVGQLTKERAALLTNVQFADPESENWNAARLKGNERDIQRSLGKPQVLVGNDMQMGVRFGTDRASFMPMSDQEAQQYNTVSNKLTQLKNDIDPKTGQPFEEGDQDYQRLLQQEAEGDMSALMDKVTGRKVDMLRAASEQTRKDTLAGIKGKTDAIDVQLNKANDMIQSIKTAVEIDPLENIRLKNILAAAKDPSALVQYLASKNTSAQDMEALVKHLASQPDGGTMVEQLRSMMSTDFMMKAYEPGKPGLPNARDLFTAEGSGGSSYNAAKLAALYGGKDEGTEMAQRYARLITDIGQLDSLSSQMQKSDAPASYSVRKTMGAQFVALPTAFILHKAGVSGYGSFLASEAMGLGVMSVPRFISYALAKPTVADALHALTTRGNDVRAASLVSQAFRDNGQTF